MSTALVPAKWERAIDDALETACPIIGAYVWGLVCDLDTADPYAAWIYAQLDVEAIATSKSTPEIEHRRAIMAAHYAGNITARWIADETALEITDHGTLDMLTSMLGVKP